MDEDRLQQIIDDLESNNSKDEADFGIFQYGGGSDESYIKANKQGLELYAAELLKASRDAKKLVSEGKGQVFPLEYLEDWIDEDSDTWLQYVEPSIEKRSRTKEEPFEEQWYGKVIAFGCVTILIVLAISTIIGLVTILNWLF